ncbi:MAG: hemolysin family protein [Eubacteriales bacterium]
MESDHLIQIICLFILILLSTFFSSAETALTTVNHVRIRNMVEEGNKRAITVQKILNQYNKMLSAILIGNNIVNISASSLTTTLAIDIWGSHAIGVATGALTLIVLIFGEIVPKTWASLNSEPIALLYSGIIYRLMVILGPIIYVVDKFAEFLFNLLHIDRNKKKDSLTESELKTIVDVSHEGGVIESNERELIYNVFDFQDALAKDIMIPRIDLTMVESTATRVELIALFRESMYTRMPVYEESQDNIIGIINIKDLLLTEDSSSFSLKDMVREAYFTYEYKNTADLMLELREKHASMALVLNEYGSTVGLVTMEDLLEEIVGEIRDEFDEDEEDFIKEIALCEYLVDGGMKLDDINDALGLQLVSEDYDSIGGIIIQLLDKLPSINEEVTTESGIILRVAEMNQNRIEKVYMILPQEELPSTTESLTEE